MRALRLFFILVIITGVIYPLVVNVVANLFFPFQAQGSLIIKNDQIVGSKLIGQKFNSDKYFHSRPSACNWNALPSFASNLGPTSKELKKQVEERKIMLGSNSPPSDLLFASGSGLDPHISLKAAFFQADRVAKARNVDVSRINALINKQKENSLLGLNPIINVLSLNLKLDQEGL